MGWAGRASPRPAARTCPHALLCPIPRHSPPPRAGSTAAPRAVATRARRTAPSGLSTMVRAAPKDPQQKNRRLRPHTGPSSRPRPPTLSSLPPHPHSPPPCRQVRQRGLQPLHLQGQEAHQVLQLHHRHQRLSAPLGRRGRSAAGRRRAATLASVADTIAVTHSLPLLSPMRGGSPAAT